MYVTKALLLLGLIYVAFLGAVIPAEASKAKDSLHVTETDNSMTTAGSDVSPEATEDDDQAVVETEEGDEKAMYIKFAGDDSESFKPTAEWQEIKPGQAIPKGLHIRMNLQTGVKEAKLLDEEDTVSVSTSKDLLKVDDGNSQENGNTDGNPDLVAAKIRMEAALKEAARELELDKDGLHYWKDGNKEGMLNLKKKTFSKEELREALKKFKATKDDVQDEKLKEESLKKTFRSYEELKQDFEAMNMGIKTDHEILTQLVESYKEKEISISKKLSILDEIEYLLHQVDNALYFVDMGAFNLVAEELNSTEPELRSQALLVLGGAMQSNPKVQIHAVEVGVLHQLVRMVAMETEAGLLNRVIFTLSSLLRHFPHAQNKFFQLGGLNAVMGIMGNSQTQPKVKVKVLTLVNDLIIERRLVSKHANRKDKQEFLKLQQYSEVDLERLLEELSWCSHLPPLLQLAEHDKREKVLVAMNTASDICSRLFTDSGVRTLLKNMKLEYQQLSKTEVNEDDKYFTGVLKIVDTLIRTIALEKEEL